MQGQFWAAAWAIIAAGVFDMLDGRIARLAKATSSFGVQYDSLSDVVSFGMAPAVLLFQWTLVPFGRLGWLAAFLFLACGALRLARFNVYSGKVPKGFFIGLPIPIAAGVIASFYIFHETFWSIDPQWLPFATLTGNFVLASLMVSTIPFPSFKDLNWRSKASFGYLLIGVLVMILLAVRPELSLFVISAGYVLLSLLAQCARLLGLGSKKNWKQIETE